MYAYAGTQIAKYKEFYPKNKPSGGLQTTILMLRMIHKNPVFNEAYPDLPVSFKTVIQSLMKEAIVTRYLKLEELCAAFDESDAEIVVDAMSKLVEMLCEDIEADTKYYNESFSREKIEIDKLNAENYLKQFVVSLERNTDILSSDDAVQHASKSVFGLYNKLRIMDQRFAQMTPGYYCGLFNN
jgi:hypothetical protein